MRTAFKLLALVVFVVLAVWAFTSESVDGAAARTGDMPALDSLAAAGWGSDAWRRDAVWDDGAAEFCAYEVEWARYGDSWPGKALLVVVKEPWAPDLDVKADRPRDDGFEVLKLNHVRDVRTGIYEYHQMASLFVDRFGGDLEKMVTTSSEACGITTSELVDGELATHSYFDGQGQRRGRWAGGLPEDGLPLLLRELVGGELPEAIEVFPSLLTGHLPPLEPVRYELARRLDGDHVVIELRNSEASLSYRFETAVPHRLAAFATGDGTRYRLARCERLAYWSMARPGAEEWWPAELR
ncbi:MAG TPA: hypothetical protein VKU40_18975 [Thermoanaerobaculia bacterium]|nr:hypothetical protein [Thermoanaerobaculia bacterium]